MTKNTSRVLPDHALVHPTRRRRCTITALAAAFSLVALYAAWYEAHGSSTPPDDELPIPQARADAATQPANGEALSATVAGSELIKRGEYLTRAGDCAACHTADKTRPFAGGLPIDTPFGTIVTPNITPDPTTGIGQWSDADFLRAMHEGIGKSGERLYPAFPYVEYTQVADRDVLAIRAYLNTLTPIHYSPPRNSLTFPFNQRWLMAFWNLFNFTEGRFVPDPKQSAEWNRGAYLVQGLAHCEECHTPRNFMQGLKSSSRFAGAVQAGWHAFNITPDKVSGVGDWRDDELIAYLSTGAAPGRANAAGPMGEVVANSTQYLTPVDHRSIVTYLRSVPPISGGESRPRDQWGHPAGDVTALRGTTITGVNGAQLFVANCATCHSWTGQGIGASEPGAYPSLIHNSTVGASTANNLAMVILHGVSRTTTHADVLMPAFGNQLNDNQVAAITNYVTRQFGNPQSTVTADQIAKLRAQQ
ncbi:Fructose dehydrogenase cytochrome subunit [Paraburkholderia ribeironis]|uniref:Fructose dehydrogenase cytochrome subunit n=1 Tax=Paraburkholderia ribeironis TaxID=1247936 RepID=A0A1N7RWN1_9BURK|nr:cytochrome c [Paraburkholderia ribeironis]SIT39530.1 Fructose dehydrogenase cytochrome subunit [Paraburkholderia ribeironis]